VAGEEGLTESSGRTACELQASLRVKHPQAEGRRLQAVSVYLVYQMSPTLANGTPSGFTGDEKRMV
jgi:hypothetical protein